MGLKKTFENKKVLITGHTGFKGSWLTIWLLTLGAKVYGLALDPPTKPSIFEESILANKIIDIRVNVQNHLEVRKLIKEIKPDFIFHLAAQPIVKQSYIDPIETWNTNVIGTINILDAIRVNKQQCKAVFITSDKCYDNLEWHWGYRENDKLGGADPYSASKGSAEIAISSFYRSYFYKDESNIMIASARAGNVIGGGDWAKDRIVPDCIRAWTNQETVLIRSQSSTRPWQHVLEPLSGYLCLAQNLNNNLNGHSFNFGPNSDNTHNVLDIVKELSTEWENASWKIEEVNNKKMKESRLLKLNCDKALSLLNWKAVLNFQETMQFTKKWYSKFYYSKRFDTYDLCKEQIKEYTIASRIRGNTWI